MRIGLDLHGTDFAPKAELETLRMLKLEPMEGGDIVPIGKVGLESEVRALGYPFVIAEDVVGMHEIPSVAVRRKPRSTIGIGMELLKRGEIDAFVSAGNTTAVLASAIFDLGRIRGIKRPALATIYPVADTPVLLVD
ncbi:phosphate--acyl-ACP acyltransferase, partial [candidate division WOR-3 bacterium]